MATKLIPPLLILFLLALMLPRLHSDSSIDKKRASLIVTPAAPAAPASPATPPPPGLPPAPPAPAFVPAPLPDRLQVTCSTTTPRADVTFVWRPIAGAKVQYIDVSNRDDGFLPPNTRASTPIKPDLSYLTWTAMPDADPVYWRVNALTDTGWVASPTLLLTPCGAQDLASNSRCDANPVVDFKWTPAALPVLAQYLDVSPFDNGFVPGTFRSVGPMSPGAKAISWDGLPGAAIVWRLNTLTTKGWISSESRAISTCDEPSPLYPRFVCTGNTVTVEFRWSPASVAVSGQWLDISRALNGFPPGTFVSSPGLPPNAETFVWSGIVANEPHYYRINSLTPTGWRNSVTRSFTALCPPS